jgi:hypothetical protein
MAVANTPAYCNMATITAVNFFYSLGPRATSHIHRNLQIGSISPWQVFPAHCNVTL